MTLTTPRDALAEQSSFIGYLVGLAGLAEVVHEMAGHSGGRTEQSGVADELVHVLLGIASLGNAIRGLAEAEVAQLNSATPRRDGATEARWLR